MMVARVPDDRPPHLPSPVVTVVQFILIVVVIFLAFTFLSDLGEGETLYVDDDAPEGGNGSLERPFNRIQDAINTATDGDTIRVWEGEYTIDEIRIRHQVTLKGNHSSKTTIHGTNVRYNLIIDADSVNITGFTFVSKSETNGYFIGIDSNSCRIFLNHFKIGIPYSSSRAISCDGMFVSIDGNTFEGYGAAIDISNHNSVIANNTIRMCNRGIDVSGGDNLRIRNNTVTGNEDGIQLRHSRNTIIEGNSIVGSIEYGAYLMECSQTTLRNNSLSRNSRGGVYHIYSTLTVMENNTFAHDGINFVGSDEVETWNSNMIDTTNTVNGKPIYYLKDLNGATVPTDGGQLILANCSNMLVRNCTFSDVCIGISMGFSDKNTIENVTWRSIGYNGLSLQSFSSNNTFRGNLIENCTFYGIIEDGQNGVMYGNSYIENTIRECGSTGLQHRRAHMGTFRGNRFENNNNNGLMIWSSEFNLIEENVCVGNRVGFWLKRSIDSTYLRNTCSDNSLAGLAYEGSVNNTIMNNTFTGSPYGVIEEKLDQPCSANRFHGNNISGNTQYGFDALNRSDSSVDARYNWWGAPSGPYHAENNTVGQGDPVTDYVNFDPWLTESPGFGPLTFYVDNDAPDGGKGSREHPFNRIQEAVNASEDGVTIFIFSGLYEEDIETNMSLTFVGENREHCQVIGFWDVDAGETVIFNLTLESVGFSDTSHGNTIERCTFSGDSSSGIRLSGSRRNVIVDCIIASNDTYGIRMHESSNNVIRNCTFIEQGVFLVCDTLDDYLSHDIIGSTVNGFPLLFLKNQTSFSITEDVGQVIVINSSNGIIENLDVSRTVIGLHLVQCTDVKVSSCEFIDNSKGIRLDQCMRITVEHCRIDDTLGIDSGGMSILDSRDCVISHCTIRSGGIAVYLKGSISNRFEHSLIQGIEDTYSTGIHFIYTSSHNVVENCTIADHEHQGIFSGMESRYNSIVNSTITGNRVGLFQNRDPYSYGMEAHGCTIVNNAVLGVSGAINATRNWWGDNSGPYHPVNNSAGKGDEVSDDVEFDPWITMSVTLYVDDDAPAGGDGSWERPFNRIQDAIDAAEEGDTIRVWEGIYYENLIINRTLGLIGNGSTTTIIDGGGEGDVVRITADRCTISGFWVRNSGSEWWNAGILMESDHNSIRNNRISDTLYGISLMESNFNVIEDNTCTGNDYRGISLSIARENTIDGNNCSHNGQYGIDLYFQCDDNILRNNTVTYNDLQGIHLKGNGNLLEGNTFSHNYGGIWISSSDRNIIVSNTCSFNTDHGISVDWECEENVLQDNTCSGNGYGGISLSESADLNEIAGNLLSNNRFGISLTIASSNRIFHNTITGNREGIHVTARSELNEIRNNSISENIEHGIFVIENYDRIVDARHNWWGDDSGPYHPEKNSDGKGDNVTDEVIFDPWTGKEDGEEPIPAYDLYVDNDAPDGGNGSIERPFNRIQDAVDAALEGDSIKVMEGTYYENVLMDVSVRLVGGDPSTTIIHGEDSGDTVLITVDYCTLEGFTLTGNYSPSDDLGLEVNSDWNVIRNNYCDRGYRVRFEGSNNLILSNEFNGTGIWIKNGQYNIIRDNTGFGAGFGIRLSSSGRNTIENNNFSNNLEEGIQLLGESNRNVVSNNTCNFNGLYGIQLYDGSTLNLIVNNTCSYNNASGIHFEMGVNYNTIERCLITYNGYQYAPHGYGILLVNSIKNSILNCTITKNQRGIASGADCYENIASGNSIFDNIHFGVTTYEQDTFEIDARYNWWGDDSGPYHPVTNPEGKGDTVTDDVIYDPWMGSDPSDQKATLSGYVTDRRGKPIVGVRVTVECDEPLVALTNESGYYMITNIPTNIDCILRIVVSKDGYQTLEDREGIHSNRIQNFTLKKESSGWDPIDLPIPPIVVLSMGASALVLLFMTFTDIGRFALFSLIYPLYTRLTKRNIEQDIEESTIRGRIYQHILDNPGTNFSRILRNVEAGNGTTSYHLKVLERNGFIKSIRKDLQIFYFKTGTKFPYKLQSKLTFTELEILTVLRSQSDLPVSQIAIYIDKSVQTASENINRLEKKRFIACIKQQQYKICSITEKGKAYIRKMDLGSDQ